MGFINNDAKRFHVYVANRVQTIRERSEPSQWHYVPTTDNPADHASRGLQASELSKTTWLRGPKFLWESVLPTPSPSLIELSPDDPEVRRTQVVVSEESFVLDSVSHFSTWPKTVAVFEKVQHFISAARKLTPSKHQSVQSLEKAERTLYRMAQDSIFHEEKACIKAGIPIKSSSSLVKLNPFLDEEGTLRVGGG